MTMPWAAQRGGLNPSRVKRFVYSSKCSEQHWCAQSLLFTEYHGSFSGIKQPGCEADHHLHVMSRSGISEAIPLFPILLSWHVQVLYSTFIYVTHIYKNNAHSWGGGEIWRKETTRKAYTLMSPFENGTAVSILQRVPVEMDTSSPNCSMLVTCWDCVYIATYSPHWNW